MRSNILGLFYFPVSRFSIWLLLLLLLAIVVSACRTSTADDGAGQVVEDYYTALVEGDVERMRLLSCADWEREALVEYEAFLGVEISLDDLACEAVGDEAGFTLVRCSGAILATYGNEDLQFDLGDLDFKTRVEAGEWRMCGS